MVENAKQRLADAKKEYEERGREYRKENKKKKRHCTAQKLV
jgi:hypothetical protein